MKVCCECKLFFRPDCNRDHFPGDPACGCFVPLPALSRKEKIFSDLAAKFAGMDDETFIRETRQKCHLYLRNTAAGQYLAEALRRLQE